jgi:hypothetical protein
VFLKEIEKPKYRPTQIVKLMKDDGYDRFTLHRHSELWRSLNAEDPAKGYGVRLTDGQWYGYDSWLNRVREHCQENAARYRAAAETHQANPSAP